MFNSLERPHQMQKDQTVKKIPLTNIRSLLFCIDRTGVKSNKELHIKELGQPYPKKIKSD
jgi:hypothetical protein